MLFLDDNVDEECEYVSSSKSSASGGCLAFGWFFCQFQPGVAYKSVAYKKSVCLTEIIWKTYEMFVRTLFSIEYRTYVSQTDIS